MLAFIFVVLDTLELDSDIKTNEMMSFLPLGNNSASTGLNDSLSFIFTIISSNAINTSLFFVGL